MGQRPARVVSLNPTTTEIIFALGVGDHLVGRSRWDAWPAEAARVPSVGDGIRPNVETILAARPALVVMYASADNRSAARALRSAGVSTLAVRVDSIAQFRRVTRLLAGALGVPERGRAIVDSVDRTLARVRRLTSGASRPTVLWRAWDTPLLVIGGGSYFTELVDIAGGRNAFADDPRPSPQVSFEEVLRRNPDRMLAGDSTAARSLQADARWRTLPAVRDGRVLVVDGELLAQPSVRLGQAAVHLATQLHPELADSLALPR
jgi:ABC-type Fe3+-hydroxamate transport system substrate-binding protein